MQTNVDAVDGLLTLKEVRHLTGKGRSGIYESMRTDPPKFPRPVKDGFSSRWVKSEILKWIGERIAERNAGAAA